MTNKIFYYLVFPIVALSLIAVMLSVPRWAYFPEWTGFRDKTVWDLLELLIVPIFLAAIAIIYGNFQRNSELQIESERRRETALRDYIDRIKELILKLYTTEDANDENSDDISEAIETLGNIGAAYTRTTLHQLDGKRKRMLLEFLYDTHLIGWVEIPSGEQYIPIIVLGESADFSELVVNTSFLFLRGVILSHANLSNSKLHGLDLYKAHLTGCNIRNSSLFSVNFSGAKMNGADLSNVKMGEGIMLEQTQLCYANLKGADLRKVRLNHTDLGETKYNNKTKFPKGFDPIKAKMVYEK